MSPMPKGGLEIPIMMAVNKDKAECICRHLLAKHCRSERGDASEDLAHNFKINQE